MRHAPPPLMLFAAGLGSRMGSLTSTRPKPLIEVAGKPLIDHALAAADEAKVERIVVNSHYLATQIEAHLERRTIQISHEAERPLETGGGLRKALPLLQGDPVMTMNTDAVWTGQNPLVQLMKAWDDARMDGLLLLLPIERATGHAGPGDFHLAQDGRLARANSIGGFVFLGAQIIKTAGLTEFAEEIFSLNKVWDQMIAAGRLFGIIHDGGWCDVGRPEGIILAEQMLGPTS